MKNIKDEHKGIGLALAELIRCGDITSANYINYVMGTKYLDFVNCGLEEFDLKELMKMEYRE